MHLGIMEELSIPSKVELLLRIWIIAMTPMEYA